jgi:hypothetical protein
VLAPAIAAVSPFEVVFFSEYKETFGTGVVVLGVQFSKLVKIAHDNAKLHEKSSN